MRRYLLSATILAAGLFVVPSVLEHTTSACAALNKRANETSNSQSAYWSPGDTIGSLTQNPTGELTSFLPDLPPVIGCAIGYWRLLLAPNL